MTYTRLLVEPVTFLMRNEPVVYKNIIHRYDFHWEDACNNRG